MTLGLPIRRVDFRAHLASPQLLSHLLLPRACHHLVFHPAYRHQESHQACHHLLVPHLGFRQARHLAAPLQGSPHQASTLLRRYLLYLKQEELLSFSCLLILLPPPERFLLRCTWVLTRKAPIDCFYCHRRRYGHCF